MNDSHINLRNLFSISDPKSTKESVNRWQKFEARLTEEIKTIKWPAAMPDLAAKIGELLDVPLPSLFLASWKKISGLQKTLEESEKTPESVKFVELAEHEVKGEYHPCIEILVGGIRMRNIEFRVDLTARLEGIVLRIRAGRIEEIDAGSCQLEGKFSYQDLTIAEKKTETYRLRGISLVSPSPQESGA